MRGREPSATRFQQGTENRRFNQIKKFLRQITCTPKNKLHYLSEKKFLVLGAL